MLPNKTIVDDQTKPSFKDTVTATYGVLRAALTAPKREHNYANAERRRLHGTVPAPEVQAVNQHLDEKKVTLDPSAREKLEKQEEMKAKYSRAGYFEQARLYSKEIKGELRIAEEFRKQEQAIAKQGAKTPIDVEEARKQRTYAKAGVWAHTLMATAKATVNPFVAYEDGFGEGCHHENLTRKL